MVCACEDVGLAYPQIIPVVKAAIDAAMMIGLPEARIPLADAVVLVAASPKSNSAYEAINAAIDDVKKGSTDLFREHFRISILMVRMLLLKGSFMNIRIFMKTIG